MKFSEFKNTEEGRAAQIVFASALDIHGVEITNENIDEVGEWLKDANDLDPNPLDTAGSGLILAKNLVDKTPAKWDDVVVSKLQQVYDVFVDTTKGVFERITDLIGIVFQSKRKSMKK